MSAKGCCMSSDVFAVCLTHALSTEREEVMGLLIGDIDEDSVARVSALKILERSDKRPDRCEISPEQLSDASVFADTLKTKLKRPMRVVGWYHSHPHITVWPSHIDVRTQADYQMMDPCFVGVIFSVFNVDKTSKESQMQVTCFQSSPQPNVSGIYSRMEVPFYLEQKDTFESHNLDCLVSLPMVLLKEEKIAYQTVDKNDTNNLVNKMYNASVYSASICNLMDTLVAPLMSSISARIEYNKLRKAKLLAVKQELLDKIQQMK